MAARHRVALSLTVLTLGAIASIPFYHPRQAERVAGGETTGPSSMAGTSPPTIALQIPAGEPEEDGSRGAGAGGVTSVAGERPGNTVDSHVASGMARDLPRISSEFPSVRESVPPMPRSRSDVRDAPAAGSPQQAVAERHGAGSDGASTQAPGGALPGPAATRAASLDGRRPAGANRTGPRRHRIRDGDTLQRLANRYLGHGDRWTEILSANRDVLQDPELLPVGATIRIPDFEPDHALDDPSARTTLPAATSADRPLTTLVPIP